MIVEDHFVVRVGLKAIINSQPDMETVAEAGNGRQAVETFERHVPDVTLMDLRIPGMNGRQFFEAVQQKSPELATRIVFLTGDMVSDSTRMFLESVGNPYLAKPFHLANVRETIAKVMASHEAETAAAHAA